MKKRNAITVMFSLIRLIKPLTGFMIAAVVMGTLGFLCSTFITVFGGYALMDVLDTGSYIGLKTIFVCVILFAVFRAALRYGEQSCNHYIAFRLLAIIRDKVFSALRTLCPAKLEGRDKGDLISVITSDIELLEVFYAHTISPICIAVIMSLIMSLYIGSFNAILGIIAAAAYVCTGAVVPIVISKLGGGIGDEHRRKSGELSAFVLDSLRGLDETIQYASGGKQLERLNEKTDSLSGIRAELSRSAGLNSAVTNTVILVFDLIMLTVCTALYKSGSVGFDGAVIPIIAMMSSFGPTVALANLGTTLQNTIASGNRVLDILVEKPVTEEITDGRDVVFSGASAQNVTFAYNKEIILDKFSFTVEQGSITGISGRSGSGKSTLLKLLMRFWAVNDGEVKISDVNIDSVNTESLRSAESYVTQETVLFHDTIAENVRIARLGASQEDIETACKMASVHDFIMSLPDGYDSEVGELGETLSGGERQRIGLARAFLHDSPFMLLDEPTSNLDSLNEAVILKSLSENSDRKTVLLVSHRDSAMRICDKVFSVENGRIS